MDSAIKWNEECVKCGHMRPIHWMVELMDGELMCRTCLWGERYIEKAVKQEILERRRENEYRRKKRRLGRE